jgi:hypothetical protein
MIGVCTNICMAVNNLHTSNSMIERTQYGCVMTAKNAEYGPSEHPNVSVHLIRKVYTNKTTKNKHGLLWILST